MSACPFKVGETYPDGEGCQVEIIHIRRDACEYPLVGLRTNHDGEVRIRSYTLGGFYTISEVSGCGSTGPGRLIPPAPPMKRVPLGPEDVPPGSIVSSHSNPDKEFELITAWDERGFYSETNSLGWITASESEDMRVKVPGGEWQPMWKEVPAMEDAP